MGQYYQPTLLTENLKVKECYNPHKYSNGMKLMEHSWIGNNLVDTILTRLKNNKTLRLVWLGDYAELNLLKNEINEIDGIEDFDKIMKEVWGKNRKNTELKEEIDTIEDEKVGYIVNFSKKEYIDLNKVRTMERLYFMEDVEDFEKYNMVINPLPLLTSVGNGQGGGDYYRNHINSHYCGVWAFDIIGYFDELPENTKLKELIFI